MGVLTVWGKFVMGHIDSRDRLVMGHIDSMGQVGNGTY
jgi:hypothetical protein